MRKGKRANIQPTAWLFALAIPAALLFVVFSLMAYGTMVKQWPLSIGQPEVMAFQKVFDRRPGQHATGEAGTLNLTSSNGNCKTGQAVAATETDTATVEVRELQGSDEGIELVGSDAQGLNGAERTALMPADLSSLEVLYAQAVADSLPIHSAPLDLVRLSRCGSDAGPFLMQEATSPSMVARSASASGTFLGPDGKPTNTSTTEATDAARMPKLTGAAFDTSASAALGLLACIEQRKDLLNAETGALYDGITGRIVPLYRMAYGADTAANTQPLGVALREALGTASAQKRIQRMAKKIHADSAAWAQRFAAIDSARVPCWPMAETLAWCKLLLTALASSSCSVCSTQIRKHLSGSPRKRRLLKKQRWIRGWRNSKAAPTPCVSFAASTTSIMILTFPPATA